MRIEKNRSPYTSLPTTVLGVIRETYHKAQPVAIEERLCSNTFHGFVKLPIELRTQIWELSLPGSRLVPIFYNKSTKFTWSNCPIPPQLHVNDEARKIARKRYTLLFGTGNNPPAIWFDSCVDELYFGVGNIIGDLVADFLTEYAKNPLPYQQRPRRITVDQGGFFTDVFDSTSGAKLHGPDFLATVVVRSGDSDVFRAEVEYNRGELQV